MAEILFCKECHEYTLNLKCPSCKSKCITPKPAKWSPEDKYAKQRLAYKNKIKNE